MVNGFFLFMLSNMSKLYSHIMYTLINQDYLGKFNEMIVNQDKPFGFVDSALVTT